MAEETYSGINYTKLAEKFRKELDKPLGTPLDQYSGPISLSAATWTDMLTYTVPSGAKLNLCEFGGFTDQDFQLKLLIGGTAKRIVGQIAKTTLQYIFVNPIQVEAGTQIKVQGYVATATTGYAWINGYLL